MALFLSQYGLTIESTILKAHDQERALERHRKPAHERCQQHRQAGSVDLENGQAEYRLTNVVKNNGGGNKAKNTAILKTTAPTMSSAFPGTNVTLNFAAASLCE